MTIKLIYLTWIAGSHPQGDAKWIAGSSPAMTKEKDDNKKRIFINHSEQNAVQKKEKSNA